MAARPLLGPGLGEADTDTDAVSDFVVDVLCVDGDAIVRVAGELDLAGVDRLVEVAALALPVRPGVVLLDLTGMLFCDAVGLTGLLRVCDLAEDRGAVVSLHRCPDGTANANPVVRYVLNHAGRAELRT